MRFTQPWIVCLLAGGCLVGVALAQQSSGESSSGAGGGSGGTGASSSFGSPAPGGSSSFGSTPPAPSSPFNPSSSFGSSPSGTSGSGESAAPGSAGTTGSNAFGSGAAEAGAASTFGLGTSPRQSEEAPQVFSVSSGYGAAPQIFVAGAGRLARPRFETRFSMSLGFDDNIFQTPTNGEDIPEQRFEVELEPAVPDQIVLVPERQEPRPQRLGPIRPAPQQPRLVEQVIPGRPAVTEEVVVPGQKAPKRQASAITRGTLTFEAQAATRRSLFTFDLNINADYYWNRPSDPSELNGGLSLIYLYRLAPRTQFTAAVSASYQDQPDVTQINTPTRTGQGEYLNLNSKFDLSHRWLPRFTTVSSLSYNRLVFVENASQSGDYALTTLGTELRYLWSPRLTGVLEGRYSMITYENDPTRDAQTVFALLGLDVTVTRRASGTIRVGASARQFEQSGEQSIAPYLETTLLYQLGKASILSWNGRFGFEEPPDANSEVLSLRSGLSVNHAFSPRLRGSVSLTGIQRVTTNDAADTDLTELTFESTASVDYTLSKHWSFNGYYTHTTVLDDPGQTDYFRNRVFVGFRYEF